MLSPDFRSVMAALIIASTLLPAVGCASFSPTLKDAFAGDFLMGAALNGRVVADVAGPAHALVGRHFNSVTAANEMKWERYNPMPGVFHHGPADALLALAEANRQRVLGHVLFWHQQTPAWVFADAAGEPVTREVLLERMRARVRELAARYGERVHTWDVVNEAVLDDGTMRESNWTRVLGDDYLPEAFRIANEELPASVGLLYNDYNMFAPGKRATVVKLIHDLRARGLRIDGVGMQGHWGLEFPPLAEIEASIVAFAAAGVRVHITELDVDVLPRDPRMFGADLSVQRDFAEDPSMNPYKEGLPPEIQERLARRYAEIFALFRKHAAVIDRVTFWGVTDQDSWLNNFPVRGRTNHPLLFDRAGQPKPALDAVIAIGRGGKE